MSYESALKYANDFLDAGRVVGEWNQSGRPLPVPVEVEQAAKTMALWFGEDDHTKWLDPPSRELPSTSAEDIFDSINTELNRSPHLSRRHRP